MVLFCAAIRRDSVSLLFIIIIIINISDEFFKPAFADGLSWESEWQQVSSNLQDSSQYSGWSQQYCILDELNLSSNFQLFQLPFQMHQLQLVSSSPSYSTAFFSSLARSKHLSLFAFFDFHSGMAKSTIWQVLFFLFIITRSSDRD